MIRQRLRGILGTTIAVAIPWTALGFLVGIVLRFGLIPGFYAAIGSPFPGGLVGATTFVGALVGVVNGLAFSGLVLAAERGKKLDEISAWRFAAWGAVASAATLGVLFQSSLGAGIGALVGAAGGVVTLRMAHRARLSGAQTTLIADHEVPTV